MRALAVASDASAERVRRAARRHGVEAKVLRLVRLIRLSPEALDRAIMMRPRYIIITSRFGARVFSERLAGRPELQLAVLRSRFIAIGPSTSEQLARLGLPVDAVPAEHSTEGIVRELRPEPGSLVLTVRSRRAPGDLEEGLRSAGASVVRADAYDEECAARRLRRDEASYSRDVALGSAFEASCLAESLKLTGLSPSDFTAHCIGPATARAARALGFRQGAVANVYTFDGLFEAMKGHGGGA